VLQDVYKSESDSNQRNQAIGALMYAYGYIKAKPQQAVDLYTRQCSIGVNVKDLANMAATLAFGGKNPVTGKQAPLRPADGMNALRHGGRDFRRLRRHRREIGPANNRSFIFQIG
jgi:glutaminase